MIESKEFERSFSAAQDERRTFADEKLRLQMEKKELERRYEEVSTSLSLLRKMRTKDLPANTR